MRLIYLLPLILLSTSAFANDAHCLFKGKKLSVGDSVWVEIPEYVNDMTEQLKAKGYSQKAIENERKQSDHTGHRLYCTKAYNIADPKGETVSEILKVTSYVLVDANPYSVLNN